MSLQGKLGNRPVVNILGGIRVQTSLQGMPKPIVYGRTRIAGNLVWYGDFTAKLATGGKKGSTGGSGSGKKGGGQYDYGAAIIIGLCQGQIEKIGAIWSTQGNLPVNQTQETYTVPSGGGSYTATQAATYLSDLGVTRGDTYSVTANDYGSPGSITLTGTQQTPMIYGSTATGHYTRSGTNSATYNFGAGDAGKTMTITYTYAPPITGGGIPQDPITTVGFTFFNGALGQPVWSYLTSKHPTQAIPYSGLAYVATPEFDLGMSGTLPNLSFEVYGLKPFGSGAGDANPSDVLYDLLTNDIYGCGIDSSFIGSMTQYSDYCLANGLLISPAIDSPRTAADWIKDILAATNSEIIETGGQLVVVPYGDTTVVANGATFQPATNPVYDLTVDDFMRSGEAPAVQIDRPTIQDAFNSVTIEYLDRGNSYNPSVVQAQDLNAIQNYKYRPEGTRQYHMFTGQTAAAKCAATILSRLVYIRNKYRFKIPQKYILLDPMDIVTLTVPELGLNQAAARILTIDEQADRTLEITAEEFPWGTSGPTLYPKQSQMPGGPNAYAPPGSINSPIIFEALSRLNNQIGHTVWFGLSGVNPNWGGCRIWVSLDGTTYIQAGTAIGRTKMGKLTATLPSHVDPDTADTLSVDISESLETLDSFTAAETNAFASLCYVAGSSSSPPPPKLADSGSGVWQLGVGTDGSLTVTSSSGTTGTLILNDSSGGSWQVGVTTSGALTTTSVTAGSYPSSAQVLDSSGAAWNISVGTDGSLATTLGAPSTAAGELVAYQNATLTSAYHYDLGTLLRRGVYNSQIGSHPTGSDFMFLDDAVEGWDYDVGIIGQTVYFKFTSFNQSGLVEENIADVPSYPYVIQGSSVGLLTPAHSSYRPTSNPLSAVDAGTTATINVAAFSMRVPGQDDIAFGAGAISGLLHNTLYYVYFDDPGFLPLSAPTYYATTVKEDALSSGGAFFIGSIQTPYAGGVETFGNNDGGGGDRIGMVNSFAMSLLTTVASGTGTVSNPSNALDLNPTTYCTLQANGGSGGGSAGLFLYGPTGLGRAYYGQPTLKILWECIQNSLDGTAILEGFDIIHDSYGLADLEGIGLHRVYDVALNPPSTQALITTSVPLPIGSNLSQLAIELVAGADSSSSSGSVIVKIHKVWIEAIE